MADEASTSASASRRPTTDTYEGLSSLSKLGRSSNSISWPGGWSDRPTDRPLASSPPACLYRLCALLKIGVHSRIPARRWPDVRRIVYRRAFCRVHSRRACVFTARASVHKRLWKGNRPKRGNTRRIDFQWARWGDFPVLNWEILLGLYGIIFLLISIDRGWFVRIGALRRDWEEIEEKSLKFFFPERVICNFF